MNSTTTVTTQTIHRRSTIERKTPLGVMSPSTQRRYLQTPRLRRPRQTTPTTTHVVGTSRHSNPRRYGPGPLLRNRPNRWKSLRHPKRAAVTIRLSQRLCRRLRRTFRSIRMYRSSPTRLPTPTRRRAGEKFVLHRSYRARQRLPERNYRPVPRPSVARARRWRCRSRPLRAPPPPRGCPPRRVRGSGTRSLRRVRRRQCLDCGPSPLRRNRGRLRARHSFR
jgi:hypothetical protein